MTRFNVQGTSDRPGLRTNLGNSDASLFTSSGSSSSRSASPPDPRIKVGSSSDVELDDVGLDWRWQRCPPLYYRCHDCHSNRHVTSTVESEVSRIRALLKERRFAEAWPRDGAAHTVPRTATSSFCSRSATPDGPDRRCADDLEQLERFHPGYSRLYQEPAIATCHERCAAGDTGIPAGRRDQPALPASWACWKPLPDERRRRQPATAAHVAKLKTLPQEVITATGCSVTATSARRKSSARSCLPTAITSSDAPAARIGAALECMTTRSCCWRRPRARPGLRRRPTTTPRCCSDAQVSAVPAELDKLLARIRPTVSTGLCRPPPWWPRRSCAAIPLYHDLLRDAPPGSPNAPNCIYRSRIR